MEWFLLKCCFWVSLVLLFQIHDHGGCMGCLEAERIALLEIKKAYFLNWTTGDAGDDDGRRSSTDCCDWEPAMIKCNATTGRVIQLYLNNTMRIRNEDGGYLNVTLFSPFEELQHLDLSSNSFDGLIENEGFERLVGLRKLEVLDLSSNHFNDSVIQSLGMLKSLKELSLYSNYLERSSHFEELANLCNLQSLDLSFNGIEASSHIIQGFKRFGGLQMLEVLDLSRNRLNNSIIQSLGAIKTLRKLSLSQNNLEGSSHFKELFSSMHMLQSLDLSYNSINGTFLELLSNMHMLQSLNLRGNSINGTLQGLCQLRNLHELDLSWNYFEGVLPPCLKNLTNLRMLDLSGNQFKGNIPSSLIPSLTSLVSISLSYNDFYGRFPFIYFANHSNLESVDLGSAGFKLEVQTENPSWVPPFQLKVLSLSNSSLNVIPRFLNNQYNLREVDLSSNNMTGTFPNLLLENNKMLRALILRDNSLSGHVVLPSNVHEAAHRIDISKNSINGLLQESIGRILPNVRYLNLSQNYFQGRIPPSIGDIKMLSVLDLSNNNFSEEIPVGMATGCNNLRILRLSNNRLQGQILPPYFNWTQLISLHLDNNSFSGTISTGLSRSSELQFLDIGNNRWITGTIPNWIGNFTFLTALIMRGNSLRGNVPIELSKLQELDFLDLSDNSLSGSMPSILNSTNIQCLHLQGNRFSGTLPPIVPSNGSYLLTLEIGDNELYGVIPGWIGGLSYLRVLSLKQNHFSGSIPNYICQLASIYVMDLSHNALSESIPPCLNNISFGRVVTGLGLLNPITGIFFSGYDYNTMRSGALEEVELIMKNRLDSYKGVILQLVSTLDLSCNNLTNGIPSEIGELNGIIGLNLSHNQLTGPIPRTLSNLTQVESLDLSYNNLNGEIPSELSILYSLEVFTVAHNNLSGKIPEMKAQFWTFTSTSYEGNPFLCGPPLPRDCSSTVPSIGVRNDDDEDDGIDINALYASFAASYVMTLFGFAAVLYINPYWQRMWFHFIEKCINSCHEFLCDTWYKLVIHAST